MANAPPNDWVDAGVRDAVLSRISFDWERRLPGWRIEFMPPRSGYRGATFPKRQLIEIYVRDGLSLDDLVHTTAHELGHAVDVTLFDTEARRTWSDARGLDIDAWWVADGRNDFSSGAGDWAECFAWLQMPRGAFYSTVGPVPTEDQLALMRRLIG